MQKIIPCLWFDDEAENAAKFYISIFSNSKINELVPYVVDTPSNKPLGSTMTVSFEIEGFKFLGLNGGTFFKKNPSISFFVNFDPSHDKNAEKNLNVAWEKLSDGGKVLMELSEYPWSKRYGWVQDKYGVSWQLILTNPHGEDRPKIMPSFLFTNEKSGKTEEAVNFYLSVFKNSKLGNMINYPEDQGPQKKGNVMFSDFKIDDTWIAAMDGGDVHDFTFGEGISLMIMCKDQKEINYFYDKLSADPSAEVCGWLKDKYGVSWQVVTEDFNEFDKNEEAMNAMLEMKRLDVHKLKEIMEGKE